MGEMTLQQALEEFKSIYMPARNLAARSRIEYANDLQAFIDFLTTIGMTRVGELSVIHVDRYLAKLDGLGFTGSTRKRKAITLRSFLSFLYRNGHFTNDISQQVILPFSEHPAPRFLTQSEYHRLIQACTNDVRDTAILVLLLQTGIRLSELVRLSIHDIHLPESINIAGRESHKGRSIPINSKACEVLQAYISIRPSSQYPSLFLNKFGQPLGERGVQKMVMHIMHQAGISNASVHSLRHTFAVQHIAKGTSLQTIQDVMGHRDIRTTEEYFPLARELAKKEMEEYAL